MSRLRRATPIKKHHSDVAIMTVRQHCRLSDTVRKAPRVSSHKCCLYNVNVEADAVALLAIWNSAVIFEKSQEWCLFFKLCPDMHTICTRFPFDDKPLTESTMV